MLTKWLRTGAPRALKKDLSFRPWLESLEDRNAPSAMAGAPPGPPPPGPHPPPPPPPHGPPPPPPGSNNITSGVNANGSFNGSTITDSFNSTINSSTVVLMPGQQLAVQGLLGFSGLLSGVLSSPQLGSLLDDEIALAVDTYLTSPSISALLPSNVVSSLTLDKGNLSAAISANPLESNPIGAILGTLAFEVTLGALTSAQATF